MNGEQAAIDALELGLRNSSRRFWRFQDLPDLPESATCVGLDASTGAWLGEEAFGEHRYALRTTRRAYYLLKRFMPRRARLRLRRVYQGRGPVSPIGWPIEQGLVRIREQQAAAALEDAGMAEAACIDFWPDGRDSAFVITHDVEGPDGMGRVMQLAQIDARHGFVSSFNFVPERYKVDVGLRRELHDMGFEVGVHGLKHDGLLFWSSRVFSGRACKINRFVANWEASGFRAPLTHRQPVWMQALNVDYDSSFFDTDPFEPMPGGTGSIWPYFCGRFVELPYTLPQDSTLFELLGECGPSIWLDKLSFITRHRGMALVNVHPDYIFKERSRTRAYETLLAKARESGCWNALPKDVACWWRERDGFGDDGHPRFGLQIRVLRIPVSNAPWDDWRRVIS